MVEVSQVASASMSAIEGAGLDMLEVPVKGDADSET